MKNKYIRNIKLYEIGIGNEGKDLYDFLKDKFGGLKEYKNIKRNNSSHYGKSEDNIIIEYYNDDNRNLRAYVKYEGLWSVFETKFNMLHTEIHSLVRWWFNRELNIGINYSISSIPGSFIKK